MVETLEDERIRAMRYAKHLGAELALNHPEIVEDYRNGKTHRQLGRKYLPNARGNYLSTAAVGYALEKLLTDEERSTLCEKHRRRASRKNDRKMGKLARKNKIGLFAMTSSEKSSAGRKGGTASRKKHAGIFAQTPEERRALAKRNVKRRIGIHSPAYDRRVSARLSLEARGLDLWPSREVAYLVETVESKRYTWASGGNRGKPRWRDITMAVNSRFHHSRTIGAAQWKYLSHQPV